MPLGKGPVLSDWIWVLREWIWSWRNRALLRKGNNSSINQGGNCFCQRGQERRPNQSPLSRQPYWRATPRPRPAIIFKSRTRD